MRLPRFTTRRLTVLATLSGLASGWGTLWWRSLEYQRLAVSHQLLGLSAPDRRTANRHYGLAGAYWTATHYPWLPVRPDPPPAE